MKTAQNTIPMATECKFYRTYNPLGDVGIATLPDGKQVYIKWQTYNRAEVENYEVIYTDPTCMSNDQVSIIIPEQTRRLLRLPKLS